MPAAPSPTDQGIPVLKKTLFQLHWFFGITAGLILALMGITGATVSFQDELLGLLNPALTVQAQPGGVLPLPELVRRIEASEGRGVQIITVEVTGLDASRVFFNPAPGERRGEMRYFDAYTGAVLGSVRGAEFFPFVLQLHRFLAVGDLGRNITGACTLILLFFCLSGLYLRWPRQALNWRAWLTLDWAKKGRSFNWDLHSVVGTWCLLVYLLLATTGLTWSYQWFNNGMTRLLSDAPVSEKRRERPVAKADDIAPKANFDALWASIQATAGADLRTFNLRLPLNGGQPATLFYLLNDSPHPRALNTATLDPLSGRVGKLERYADKPLGEQLLGSVYALHTGSYFGLAGRVVITLAALCMPLFFITGWLLYLDRKRKQRQVRAARLAVQPGFEGVEGPGWLIAFASQSGQAEQLAWNAAGQLQAAGLAVRVRPLASLSEAELSETRKAVFVISTFGDGQAPDSARAFERQVLGKAWALDALEYALLSLGDRQYGHFCAFGQRLDGWLQSCGAQPAFAPIEVDNGDPVPLRAWQERLGAFTGSVPVAAWQGAPFEDWTLLERRLLNPGSAGGPVYLLGLQAPAGHAWQAGDLLETLPRPSHDGALSDEPREYSIASLPGDGPLQLLVRQERHADGSLGLGSGWLTERAPLGVPIRGRVRRNNGFHLIGDDRPLILIGNGTGLAGLRALLKESIGLGRRRHWLLFGERNVATDFHLGEELQGWLAEGALQRLDLAFSRDQEQKIYVQNRLREGGKQVRQWLDEGAAIYVCGSLEGMALGVEQVLAELIGTDGLDALVEQGRYRRDVY
jgi:sulfite reductase (NADPH) flavoprotein alpha-component